MFDLRWIIVALGGAFAGATTVAGQEEARPVPSVPSGIALELLESVVDTPGDLGVFARFRFVAPAIGDTASFADVEADFPYLCENYALPALQKADLSPERIVISFSAAPIEFGASDPGVVQFFEAFRVENGTCIWEGF